MSAFTDPSSVPIHSPTTGTSFWTTGTTRTTSGGGGGACWRAQAVATRRAPRARMRSAARNGRRSVMTRCVSLEVGVRGRAGGAPPPRASTAWLASLGPLLGVGRDRDRVRPHFLAAEDLPHLDFLLSIEEHRFYHSHGAPKRCAGDRGVADRRPAGRQAARGPPRFAVTLVRFPESPAGSANIASRKNGSEPYECPLDRRHL